MEKINFSGFVQGRAGIAIAFSDRDTSDVAFAFQVGAGLRWEASESVSLDVGYRLRGIQGPTFDPEVNIDWLWSHNAIVGVSFGI